MGIFEEDGLTVAAVLERKIRLGFGTFFSFHNPGSTHSSSCSPARFTSFQHYNIGLGCLVQAVTILLQEVAGNAGSRDATPNDDNISSGGQVSR